MISNLQEQTFLRTLRTLKSSPAQRVRLYVQKQRTDSLFGAVGELTHFFNSFGIKCVAGGSVAASMFMEPRYTGDLDMNLICKGLEKRDFIEFASRIPHFEFINFHSGVVPNSVTLQRHVHSIACAKYKEFPVDFFIHGDNPISKRILERSFTVRVDNEAVHFPPGECLCFWKMMRSAEYADSNLIDVPLLKEKHIVDIKDVLDMLRFDQMSGAIDRKWVSEMLRLYEPKIPFRKAKWEQLSSKYPPL